MTELDLLIDLHLGNDRLGPGGRRETHLALELTGIDPHTPIHAADLGCGTGASALVLARSLNAHVHAVDAAPPFVDRLRQRADDVGLGDRITARIGDMSAPPFEDGALDLIWSEGAVYNIGFETGVRAWRRFLRPGGVIALSDLSWTTADRPAEIEQHWVREYPSIATISANVRTLEDSGYTPLGVFVLPDRCWDQHYYAPLRAGFAPFLERHGHSPAARAIIDSEEREIQLRAVFGWCYAYAFYIARASDGLET